MSTAVPAKQIWLNERGIAWVDDTKTKVVEIVLDSHLSLAQIHAALASNARRFAPNEVASAG